MSPWVGSSSAQRRTNRSATPNTGLGPSFMSESLPAATADPYAREQVTYPMGSDALGSLLYTADGHFSVTISKEGRGGFAAGDLLGGTTEEKAPAVEGSVAYAGRYSFHGDRVVHHVELSLFLTWVGTDQQRSVERTGNRLTFSASPLLLAGTRQCPAWSGSGSTPSPGPADWLAAARGRHRKSVRSVSGQAWVGPASPAPPRPADATSRSGLGPTAAIVARHSARTSRPGRPPPGRGSTAPRGPQPGPGLRRALTARWRTAPRWLGPRPAGRPGPVRTPAIGGRSPPRGWRLAGDRRRRTPPRSVPCAPFSHLRKLHGLSCGQVLAVRREVGGVHRSL